MSKYYSEDPEYTKISLTDKLTRDKIEAVLKIFTQEMENYSYYGSNPSKQELLDSLRNMAAICEAHGNDMPKPAQHAERQQAVHWRAVLDPAEVPMQLNPHEHIAGFTDRRKAEDWIAARLCMDGWHYTLEPLYASQPPAQDVSGLVEALEAIVRQYPNPDITHVDYRVQACKQAEHALEAYRVTLAAQGTAV